MKKEKCNPSNMTICAMAAAVLGLFGTSALLAVAAVGRRRSDALRCPAETPEQEAE